MDAIGDSAGELSPYAVAFGKDPLVDTRSAYCREFGYSARWQNVDVETCSASSY